MNIIVLHGDDIVKSRERLEKFIETAKGRGWEIQRIDFESEMSLPEALSATSLFQKGRLFVLEQPNKLSKKDFIWLKKQNETLSGNLAIYNDSPLSKTFLKALPQSVKVEEFKLPKIIFDFLSSFYPGNAKRSMALLHKVAEYEPMEFVFSLLARQLKDLYLAKISPTSLSYPSWRVGKLKIQSSKFTKESLESFISLLADLDVKAKTGGPTLIDSLDLTIISQLQ